jgi:hypothetical protein
MEQRSAPRRTGTGSRFVDGILLHQVFQWHHMLSSTGSDNDREELSARRPHATLGCGTTGPTPRTSRSILMFTSCEA